MSVTVCIPTIPARRSLLSRLLWHLQGQALDVIVADGNQPMGDKLNDCFAAATTSHVVCVDDDDLLASDYSDWVDHHEQDFIGYRILWLEDGRFAGSVSHRGDGDTSWVTLERGVSPKCPVRTEIARSIPFGNHYTADREWSAKLQAELRSHTFVHRHLYTYDHWNAHMVGTSPDHPQFGASQRDVGEWPIDWRRVRWL